MTLRNNLGYVPKSLSPAKSPKMTTPLFIRSVTFNITISFIALAEGLKMFRMAMLGVIEQFKIF